MTAILQTVAILAELAGVILLFRYGMPFRVKSLDGMPTITWTVGNDPDPDTLRLDKKHTVMGYLGLTLIGASALLQILLVWRPAL